MRKTLTKNQKEEYITLETENKSSLYKFYVSGLGERLINPMNLTPEVVLFFQEEENILNSLLNQIDLLIEVGCMNGLHLNWAIQHEKKYIGVDFVPWYVELGREQVQQYSASHENYQFFCGNAENIGEFIHPEHLGVERASTLLFFPFNSFGSISSIEKVLTSIRTSNLPFLISTYQTNDYAITCCLDFYQHCGYQDVHAIKSSKGVNFLSSDGIDFMVYSPEYLNQTCMAHILETTIQAFPPFNLMCASKILFDKAADNSEVNVLQAP
jgi:hypothetical protein